MDTDGSGEISLSALKQVLVTNASEGSLGALTEEEVEDVFNAMRVKKAETRIHWHEFIAAGLSQCQVDDRNLRLAFDRLDSDHKGVSFLFTVHAIDKISFTTTFHRCGPVCDFGRYHELSWERFTRFGGKYAKDVG